MANIDSRQIVLDKLSDIETNFGLEHTGIT